MPRPGFWRILLSPLSCPPIFCPYTLPPSPRTHTHPHGQLQRFKHQLCLVRIGGASTGTTSDAKACRKQTLLPQRRQFKSFQRRHADRMTIGAKTHVHGRATTKGKVTTGVNRRNRLQVLPMHGSDWMACMHGHTAIILYCH